MNAPFTMSEGEDAAFLAMSQEKEIPAEVTTEAAEETQSEQAAESTPEKTTDPTKKPSMVPHQALHEARLKEKEARDEIQRLREERAADMARVDERLKRIQEIQQPGKQAQDGPPDFDEDPLGHMKWVSEQFRQQSRVQTEEQQRARQFEEFKGSYLAKTQEFIKEEPTFTEAYNFLSQNRYQEYVLAGYTPDQATAALHQDETNIAWQAMQQGVNPAKRMMELAKHRGWAPKAKEAEKPAAADKIAATADALARGKSMSSAGGAATPGEMTAETLLSMSNDEFDAWCSKNPAKAKKIMGG